MTRILLAEDDEIMRITVQDRLEKHGWSVDAVANGREALELLGRKNYHLIVSDIRMPGLDGRKLLEEVKQSFPRTDVIMMTAYGSVDDAISCLKQGAADYILKPFDMDDLVIRITRLLEMQTIRARCVSLEDCCRQLRPKAVWHSPAMLRVLETIRQVAPTDSTVLITGESGTGKEVAAEAIVQLSRRAGKPYIRINCAAIPEGLMESELFGHEKGAFTGAQAKKPGKFELADGGTLLLDEIGDLPLPLQAKLLRVLQERVFERVGGTRSLQVDLRLLCSTAKDLQAEVAAGRFRQDLYYRLGVIPLVIPPLRERPEDIPALLKEFVREFSVTRGEKLTIAPEAMTRLLAYDYPGNVRELRNIIERMSVLARGPLITTADLPHGLRDEEHTGEPEPNEPLALGDALARAERVCLLKALEKSGGNRTAAAHILGISRKNLWEKLRLHGISL
ncbi:MAG: sigma-54-dependent Fis family transcriptional regulator [Desulfobulbaceae bacterium A2]|nr:MAG: sigma-54-dependent Fis family transcriptional regulator [Desulfobulbaceae bacterium A2]